MKHLKNRSISLFLISFFCSLAAVASVTSAVTAKPAPTAVAKIVDRLQESWDAAHSYEADFHQEVTSKTLGGDPEASNGVLSVIKPNKLRWDTQTDGSLEILNNNKLISIQSNPRRKNREVDIWDKAAKTVDSKLLNFLAGRAPFKKLYEIQLKSENDQSAELKFTAKNNNDESYIAEIDKSSYLLRSLTIDSVESKTTIKFSKIKTNLPLKDSLFEYEKKTTDIVHQHG